MKHIAVLAVATAFLIQTLPVQSANAVGPGDDAPEFVLKGSDGKTYQLSDFKGKQAVVIAWFPKAFTPGCTRECTALGRDGDLIKEYDVTYFTASVDTEEDNKRFAKEVGADYPILSDPGKAVARAYGVVTDERQVPYRWTFFIGKDGKILAVDKDVKPDTHAADIAAKLKELGVAKKH